MVGTHAVLGLQWGDEGKGKVTDELAGGAAAVMRFQGGANAGHSLLVGGRAVALHQVPCGALHPGVLCVIGAGCAVDPVRLRDEVADLRAAGCDLAPSRLVVSARAQVVLPWMADLDAAEEDLRGEGAVGTTRRGIGPAYAAKAGRWGLTVGALVDAGAARERMRAVEPWVRLWRGALGLQEPPVDALSAAAAWLRPFVGDDLAALRRVRGRVVLEGQLGLMRDPDRGPYPYVTGASMLPPAALLAKGAAVLGVAKPYVTAVGGGPLPTEAAPREAAALRTLGGEFGATTGRPRRCGWLDLPALRYAAYATGATALAVTKLDLLPALMEALEREGGAEAGGGLPVCTHYDGWDERSGYPLAHELASVRPVLARWPVEGGPESFARRMAQAVGLPLAYAGTGPGRGEGVWYEEA